MDSLAGIELKADEFRRRAALLRGAHDQLLSRENHALPREPYAAGVNGVWQRFANPVITPDHVPLDWRFDFNREANPMMLERLAVNGTFNPGAIEFDGKICLAVRVEGADRKSFFAIAESENGVDRFRFRGRPIVMPETDSPEVNLYDMRLTLHEDGWIYGVFCAERRDEHEPRSNTEAAEAQCGIARTRDLDTWERLPNLQTGSPQQRNVVLHAELVGGRYAFYTRPQDGFIEAGTGGGIGFGLCDDITDPVVHDEHIIDERRYHTIKESKNGLGPAPIKTEAGWLHSAHGVRNTAAGLRYVLYLFVTDLANPSRVIARPGGYVLAPHADERIGDVSNVLFSNGWVVRDNGVVLMYYGSSDSRCHVAQSTVETLIDYCFNTPADPKTTAGSVQQRLDLIRRNKGL